ncbi:MAG: hypothetical protein JW991_04785 [Candidatus Pacebacteria bacterium]|nr:hypothetical protein [Candidatus Paceibacterota bacterium]
MDWINNRFSYSKINLNEAVQVAGLKISSKKRVDEDQENEGLAHKGAALVTVDEIWDLSKPRLLARK